MGSVRKVWREELAKSKHDGPAIWPESRGPVFPATLTHAAQNRSIRLYYVKASLRASDGAGRCYIDNKGKEWSLDKWFAAYRMKGVTGKKFPQTSTFNLSFTRDDFNTYRELGRLFGVALGEAKHRGK